MSPEDNARLTEVGPGTPMGALMRRYWLPACLSLELQPGGAPLRLALMGEGLVAFRGPDGAVGVLDHACPHRRASLFLGRNEAGGLRCVYHGWKFAPSGACLETPNLPPEMDIRDRVRAPAYPAAERHGVVWAYLGEGEPPPLPAIEALLLPEAEVKLSCSFRACNWLQVLEGEIDTSHFGFLHSGSVGAEDLDPADMHSLSVRDRAPRYHVAETPWGAAYAAWRDAGGGRTYWRVAHYLAPFWTMFPDGALDRNIVVDAAVPMDDTHTMVFSWMYRARAGGLRKLKDGRPIPGLERDEAYLPNGSGWFERWRTVANEGNDWLIDRNTQASASFTGLTGVQLQDQAVVESMGPVVDRSRELLTLSDKMIGTVRRRLLDLLRADGTPGFEPPGQGGDPEVGLGARSGAFLADAALDWRTAYADQLRKAADPTGRLRRSGLEVAA